MFRVTAVLVLAGLWSLAVGPRSAHALQDEAGAANQGGPKSEAVRHGEDVAGLLEAARTAELAGDNATRKARLDEAFQLAGTGNIELNRMRGLVFEQGRWLSAAEVAELSARDPALAAYRTMRQQAPDTLDGNVGLAAWCRANGLAEQARAHLLRALSFDMENDVVRRRLGHQDLGGRWVSQEQLSEMQSEGAAAQQRLELHRAEVEGIALLLNSPRKKKRDEGLLRLGAIDDPSMITAIEVILAPLSEPVATAVIDKLAGFSESEATGALLRLAVSSPWPAIRDEAASRLGQRDKYDYMPTLISMLAGPAVSQFSILPDRTGNLLFQHTIAQQTAEADVIRQSDRAYLNPDAENGQYADSRGTLAAVSSAGREAKQREEQLQKYNRQVAEQNSIVMGLLRTALGMDLGNDPSHWWAWWYEENDIYFPERPVSYRREQVRDFIRSSDPDFSLRVTRGQNTVGTVRALSCLVAGTPVWTESGLVAIEKLRVGDRVLARDTVTGAASFRGVVRPTVRPASPTLRIQLASETIVASGGHPFWVNGTGWIKARELKPKMLLQTIEGPAEIVAIEPGATVELYNLVVDGDSTYFVGEQGVLSHDNTIPSRGSRSIQNQKTR